MSKHFLEWSVPEHLRLVGIVIICAQVPCSQPSVSRDLEGRLPPRLMRGMKQLGKSGDLLIVCYGARRGLKFRYALESLGRLLQMHMARPNS